MNTCENQHRDCSVEDLEHDWWHKDETTSPRLTLMLTEYDFVGVATARIALLDPVSDWWHGDEEHAGIGATTALQNSEKFPIPGLIVKLYDLAGSAMMRPLGEDRQTRQRSSPIESYSLVADELFIVDLERQEVLQEEQGYRCLKEETLEVDGMQKDEDEELSGMSTLEDAPADLTRARPFQESAEEQLGIKTIMEEPTVDCREQAVPTTVACTVTDVAPRPSLSKFGSGATLSEGRQLSLHVPSDTTSSAAQALRAAVDAYYLSCAGFPDPDYVSLGTFEPTGGCL